MAAKRKAVKRKSRSAPRAEKRRRDDNRSMKMVGHVGNDIEVLMVQYPRGCSALVWFNPMAKRISTDHAGLRAMLQRGVKDWEGRLLFPHDGRAFLAALYDYLLLNGYSVCWTRGMAGGRPIRPCN